MQLLKWSSYTQFQDQTQRIPRVQLTTATSQPCSAHPASFSVPHSFQQTERCVSSAGLLLFPWYSFYLCSSWALSSVCSLPAFRGSLSVSSSRELDCWGLGDGTDMRSRNVRRQLPTWNVQRNVPEERRRLTHRCWWWEPLKAEISWSRILPENSWAQLK